MAIDIIRCEWAGGDPLSQKYHDEIWGVPVHDDRTLFKMLTLEGMQAGLSWGLILRKWDTLCAAFDGFDPAVIIGYGEAKVEELLKNAGIIKNRLKINAVINNARVYFDIVGKYGSFNDFLWNRIGGAPVLNRWTELSQIPTQTAASDQISRDLKKLGMKFVGSTVVYSFMQAVGMVNDHIVSCSFYNHGYE